MNPEQKLAAQKHDTEAHQQNRTLSEPDFPPKPPSKDLIHKVATGFVKATAPSKFVEKGCAICGKLTLLTELIRLADVDCNLDILIKDGHGVTCKEQFSEDDPIEEIIGPILDHTCDSMCCECQKHLEGGLVPPLALANDLWIGNVPEAPQGLTYAKKLLVAT